MMKDFITSKACRMKLLAEYFGDEVEDCEEKCDNCITTYNGMEVDECSPSKRAKLM